MPTARPGCPEQAAHQLCRARTSPLCLPTAEVGDRDVLCATTEFGTLEPFYCPENARQVVCGLQMDDGLTLCVYLDPLNKACADLVNAAGEQVDHIELGIEGDNGDFR